MDYGDKANARQLLSILIDRDAEILDDLMLDYADCINALIESIWNHGIYDVTTCVMQERDIKKRQTARDMAGFEGTTDALDEFIDCYKTGDEL